MDIVPIKTVPQEVIDKVSTAKVSLMTQEKFTFFTAALMRLNLNYVNAGTLATDGVNLFVNPDFVKDLTNRQIAFGLMHETFHVIYEHIERKGNRDHKTWNKATDFVINNQLDHMGLDVIKGICLDHQYDDMSADQVYAKLMADPNLNNGTQPSFDDMLPAFKEGTPDSNGNPMKSFTPDEVKQHVQDIIDGAIVASQLGGEGSAGSIPGNILRDYQERLNPLIDWKSELIEFMFATGKQGKSYKRPSRRSRAVGVIMQGSSGKGLGRIDFSIDTSGSVTHEMFNQFIGELSYVMDKLKPKQIGVSQFDHILQGREVINSISELEDIQFQGGGGTNIEPVLSMFKDVDSKALIVLTDGWFRHSASMDPGKPVVWCIYNNPNWQPPFGRAIHFTMKEL